MVIADDVRKLVEEARARGVQYLINDLSGYAALIRDRMREDDVRLDSRQSWASMEALIAILEENVSRETSASDLEGAADEPPADGTYPASAAEFAARWNSRDGEYRDGLVAQLGEWSQAASDCFVQNHKGRLEHLEQLRDANVSRETLHAHDATWVDPLRLQLGQQVAAYPDPIRPGDEPVAVGAFVHVVAEGSLDRDATVVLDDNGSAHRLLIREHHFAISKG